MSTQAAVRPYARPPSTANRSHERIFFGGMTLGLWLYGLAAVMIPIGVLAAANEIKRDFAAGPPYTLGIDPVSFSIVSVNGMLMFGTLMASSYLVRRNPAAHKRLALYAVISMMNAGSDRWPWDAWGIREHWSVWFYTLLLLLPVVYDLISLRKVHNATLFAAPFVWLLHFPDSIRQDRRVAHGVELYAEALGVGMSARSLRGWVG
jgi:hypothetical protein